MSLVWFSGKAAFDGETDSKTLALIEEKTGVVITRNTYRSADIKFPDMSETTRISCLEMRNSMGVCFVDVENHFFAYALPHEDAKTFDKPLIQWMRAMVYEIDGKIWGVDVDSDRINVCDLFNVPSTTRPNTSKDSFCIIPAYSTTGYGFIKNLFVNYDRFFNPGQKIIDDSGNVFITLGGYFLYYNGKNK